MARPLGPLARQILTRLSVGPSTAARLAQELELPVRRIVVACYWLRVAGRIQVHSSIVEGGCWRAVAVYSVVAPSTLGPPPFPTGFVQGRHDGP
ncbi:hypothetical protein D3C71_318240 [compost metagenome]